MQSPRIQSPRRVCGPSPRDARPASVPGRGSSLPCCQLVCLRPARDVPGVHFLLWPMEFYPESRVPGAPWARFHRCEGGSQTPGPRAPTTWISQISNVSELLPQFQVNPTLKAASEPHPGFYRMCGRDIASRNSPRLFSVVLGACVPDAGRWSSAPSTLGEELATRLTPAHLQGWHCDPCPSDVAPRRLNRDGSTCPIKRFLSCKPVCCPWNSLSFIISPERSLQSD